MRLSSAPPIFDGEVTRAELGTIKKAGLYKIKEESGIVKYGNITQKRYPIARLMEVGYKFGWDRPPECEAVVRPDGRVVFLTWEEEETVDPPVQQLESAS